MIQYCEMDNCRCGFLIGCVCKANPAKPIWIDGQRFALLKVVGCASFQEYLDYDERRKRHGSEAVGKDRGTEDGAESSSESCGEGDMARKVQKLQVDQLGGSGSRGRQETLPMQELQEDNPREGNPEDRQPADTGIKCIACGKPAVVQDQKCWFCRTCGKKLGLIK